MQLELLEQRSVTTVVKGMDTETSADWQDDLEEDVTSPAFYRARAQMMLEQARHAANQDIKMSCLDLAQSWERLAAHAEHTAHMLPPTYGRAHDGAQKPGRKTAKTAGPAARGTMSSPRYR